MTNSTCPSPVLFGMPEKFSEWRTHQDEAFDSLLRTDSRFVMQICPTGFGKSLTYMVTALTSPGRSILLTSTKGLQSQLIKDFGKLEGVVDIRGKGNYKCIIEPNTTCDSGPCSIGDKCALKEGGCLYYDKYRDALNAKVVVTNFAYWMTMGEYGQGLGKFNLLVCDEAHAAPDHLTSHMEVQLRRSNSIERELRLDNIPGNHSEMRTWAVGHLEALSEHIKAMRDGGKDVNRRSILRLLSLKSKLSRLATMRDDWVWEDDGDCVTLSPVWPAPYAEGRLFLGVAKVLFTSATCIPKTANMLGVSTNELQLEEYPHSFPLRNRMLYHVPTIRLNFRTTDMEMRQWVSRIDQILRGRRDRKGIIHTVSYKRRDTVMVGSKLNTHMISHKRRDTELMVKKFKLAEPPLILVSPSMATGWDFPDDECRFQIIGKLPYPDTRGQIMKARTESDRDYTSYIAMQQLVQACGRGVRSEDDWCETFVIDDNIKWFIPNYKDMAPEWFREAYVSRRVIPKAIQQ